MCTSVSLSTPTDPYLVCVTNIGRPRPPKLNPADYRAELTPAIDLHMLYQEAKKSNPIPADWTLAWRRRLGGMSGGLIIRPQVEM
jgi:hypothetical protein